MNPTQKKLKKLFKNSISFPKDHPIYSEPPGILFTAKLKPGKENKNGKDS